MITLNKTILAISVSLAIAGCGDSISVATSSAGKAVDGYLSGSQVVCDTNNNGVKDTGEASTTTNSTGDFTFTPSCASTIVISGGTSTDTGVLFKGLLKAPAGSAIATPLTSLMVSGGLTAAQVATAMGLPTGTDITKIDPMAAGNLELRTKTVAMQVIIQQVADTLGGLAADASPATIQALYSQVAKAVANTISANPSTALVSNSGAVNATLVNAAVVASVAQLGATTDPVLLAAKAATIGLSSASLANLISESVTAQASTLVQADAATLVAKTTALQQNTAIAFIATASKAILTSNTASSANWSTVKAQLAELSDASTTNDAAAISAVTTALATAATSAGVTPPVIPANMAGSSNSLSINNDLLTFSKGSIGTPATLTAFKASSGITLADIPDTISFAYTINGSPISSDGSDIAVGLSITEIGGAREVKVILDKVNLSVSGGALTATVPANAKVFAYGVNTSGVKVYKTITNTAANQLLAASGTNLSFNVTNVLDVLMDKADSVSNYPFGNLYNVKGAFNVTVLVSNLAIASGTTGAVQSLSLNVPAAVGNGLSLNGLGIVGKFTLQ